MSLYILLSETNNKLLFYPCCFHWRTTPLYSLSISEFFKLHKTNKLQKKLLEINAIKGRHCSFHKTDSCILGEHQFGPVIQISVSKVCNLRCPFCYVRSGHHDSQLRKKIYFILLEAVKGIFPGYTLRLTDFGEPFFYTEEILNYLASLTDKDFTAVYAFSNGTLLNPNVLNRLKQSLQIPLRLNIDFDSMNKITYESMRVNANYNKVLNNINYLNKIQDDKLILNRISQVYKDETELPAVADFAASLKTAEPGVLSICIWKSDLKIFTEE